MSNEKEIVFLTKKDPNYREIYADGFWGGTYPSGVLKMAPYSEITRRPDKQKQKGSKIENVFEDVVVKSSQDVLIIDRVFQCEIIMTINAAKNLVKWLSDKLEEFEKAQKEFTSQEKEKKSSMYG